MSRPLKHRSAVLVLASVVLMWGLTWVATKIIVQHVAPFWVTGIRCAIASVVLLGMLVFSRQFVLPRRGDVPVILSIALLHLVAFSTLVNFGLQLVPLGRSIVLGYTVPLWVTPGAAILLGERMTRGQSLGVALGLAGLVRSRGMVFPYLVRPSSIALTADLASGGPKKCSRSTDQEYSRPAGPDMGSTSAQLQSIRDACRIW